MHTVHLKHADDFLVAVDDELRSKLAEASYMEPGYTHVSSKLFALLLHLYQVMR